MMALQYIQKQLLSSNVNLAKRNMLLLHQQAIRKQDAILSVYTDQLCRKKSTKVEDVQHLKNLPLKPPKGTRDFTPPEMISRTKVLNVISEVFKMHGAVEIDTPVFELKAVLTGRYGEDTMLTYDLDDQGGEMLSLRYDLTVPFARYLAEKNIRNIKRYHIARVYRRDQPSFVRGRYREFYQCDFDVAGNYEIMVPDAECIHVTDQILHKLQLGEYVIKINHRKVLTGILSVCGVAPSKFRDLCSSVDKLDKVSWEEVKKEMVEEKELSPDVADKIGEYVILKGGLELLDKLQSLPQLNTSTLVQEGIKELKLMYDYCDAFSCTQNIQFDMSLARGLDYYTGVIFEAVLLQDNELSSWMKIGSIAGGGRYDELVGKFKGKGPLVPCVGVSFGMERIFAFQERKEKSLGEEVKSNHTQVLVCSPCSGYLRQRLRLVSILHDSGIYAETMSKANPKLWAQFKYAEKACIPYLLITGEEEESQKIVKLRLMSTRQEEILPADAFTQAILDKFKKSTLS